MISIFVTIRIKEGFAEQFTEASFGDAQGSTRDEPGCFRFDILNNSEDPNLFHLYEVYADEAALGAHREAPHYKEWRSTVQDWFDGDLERVMMTTVFPSDQGWRDQKTHLLNW
jgi:quinol monooxygenase YgiN